MQNQNPKKDKRLTVVKAANFIFDVLLPPMRALFFPFYGLTRLFSFLNGVIWLMSNEFTKRKFKHCGLGVRLHGKLFVSSPQHMEIGDNVHINENTFIRAEGGLAIGDNTHISRNLVVYTMNHNYEGDSLPYDERKILKPVTIGKNVWIGMNVVIVPGVTIGDGAIVGMGTIVSKDVPPLAIVGSAAIRELKYRNDDHYRRAEFQSRYSGTGGFPLS